MDTRFDTCSGLCAQTSAGKRSIVEVSSETNVQIESFDGTISAVVVADSERASETRKGCGDVAERANTVSVVVIREMWNE
jgi:hypothetical protein